MLNQHESLKYQQMCLKTLCLVSLLIFLFPLIGKSRLLQGFSEC